MVAAMSAHRAAGGGTSKTTGMQLSMTYAAVYKRVRREELRPLKEATIAEERMSRGNCCERCHKQFTAFAPIAGCFEWAHKREHQRHGDEKRLISNMRSWPSVTVEQLKAELKHVWLLCHECHSGNQLWAGPS
jgi:hypothetical protein